MENDRFDMPEPEPQRVYEGVKISDDEIEQFARGIGLEEGDPRNTTRRTYVRRLLELAEPNIIDMVKRKLVGVQSAACFVYGTPREKQRGVSPQTVKHEGNIIKRGGGQPQETREHKRALRQRNQILRQRQIDATKAAIERGRARSRVSAEEFERPPPELLDQEYPGRPGFTYASVHREQHGPIWINVSAKRRRDLVIKLGEIATEFSRQMEKLEMLDDRQRSSVFHRWRRALQPFLKELNATSDDPASEQAENPETLDKADISG